MQPKKPSAMTREIKLQQNCFQIIVNGMVLSFPKFLETKENKEFIFLKDILKKISSSHVPKHTYKITRTEEKIIQFHNGKKKLTIYHDNFLQEKFIEIKEFQEKFGKQFSKYEGKNHEKKEMYNF